MEEGNGGVGLSATNQVIVRLAEQTDLDRIEQLAKRNTQELGFLPRVVIADAIEKNNILIEENTGAFILYRIKQDGTTTVQYVCVPKMCRGKGIGKSLIWCLPLPIILKCPAFLPSNDFYRAMGFKHCGFEQNGKRPVNVWRLEDE